MTYGTSFFPRDFESTPLNREMLIRIVLLAALYLVGRPAAAQFSAASMLPDRLEMTESPGLNGPEITAPICTNSRTSKFICGGLVTGLGISVLVPSARILIEAIRADPSNEDPTGIGSSLGAIAVVLSGSLVVLGGALTYLGAKLLIDAFRPQTKYAFRPLAGRKGTGLAFRVSLR